MNNPTNLRIHSQNGVNSTLALQISNLIITFLRNVLVKVFQCNIKVKSSQILPVPPLTLPVETINVRFKMPLKF